MEPFPESPQNGQKLLGAQTGTRHARSSPVVVEVAIKARHRYSRRRRRRRRRRRFGGFRAQSGAANGAVRVGLGPRDDTLVVEHVLARRDGDLLAALEVLEADRAPLPVVLAGEGSGVHRGVSVVQVHRVRYPLRARVVHLLLQALRGSVLARPRVVAIPRGPDHGDRPTVRLPRGLRVDDYDLHRGTLAVGWEAGSKKENLESVFMRR